MKKSYNSAKDLLILAHMYKKAGRVVEAAKIAIKAMDEEDAEELFEALDEENDIEMASEEHDDPLENLTAEDLECGCEKHEAEAEEEPKPEEKMEEEHLEEHAEEKEEEKLPSIEEAVAKVHMLKKKALANKATISGDTSVKAKLARKLLRK